MKKKIIGLAFTIAVVSALSTAAYASTFVNNEDVQAVCLRQVQTDIHCFR